MPKLHLPPVHPEHLIAYSVVHHPQDIVAHEPIIAIGALEVELGCGTDVRFKRHQKFYTPERFPHPMHDILDLVRDDTYLVSAKPHRVRRSRTQWLQHSLQYEMLRYGLAKRHRRQTHIMRVEERLLHTAAGDFAFSLATPGAAVGRKAEMASDRAQAIWLMWSFQCLHGDPDYDAIMASFRAWRVLNEQRAL